ncbi:MAG: putative zinc-binding protein [Halobacteria archaeon]
MTEKCICEGVEVIIFPCSGAANVGQIANRAAVELAKQGFGNMFCTAAIGAGIKAIIESARASGKMLAIDGCRIACASEILKKAGFNPLEIVVTNLGIKKNFDLNLNEEEVKLVIEKAKELIRGKK